MTQIILMYLCVKFQGENITPNHLHKNISCKAKCYCTPFLPGYQQFASFLLLALGKQHIPGLRAPSSSKPHQCSPVWQKKQACKKFVGIPIGLDVPQSPSCMSSPHKWEVFIPWDTRSSCACSRLPDLILLKSKPLEGLMLQVLH